MFLKTLSLKGFKSFADHALLDLEPGVTVVVGPNGSGKSNVVDAIAWVLGAQAPSAVRSQKMDDVIFAGTAKRQALGRAEVALTIDNSARLLPIEFEEVTITRTLFRTGESEYSINGVPCRLLDIQELLSDSGVGRQQHVIVSQGQIDAVLNARPEERRSIVEEAAGVLKYRRRKEKAERRLNATEENLNRVQDLVREVRRGLRPLERQAEAARRHGEVISELQALQIHVAGREIAGLRSRLQQVGVTRRDLAAADRALRGELNRLDGAVTAAEARLTVTGADHLGDTLTRVESLRERARGLVALLSERLRGIEREQGASVGRDVVAALEHEASTIRVELAQVEDETGALAPRIAELAAAEEQLAEQRSLFDHDTEAEVEQPTGQAAEVRGELQALARGIEGAERDQAELEQRLATLTDTVAERQREVEHRQVSLADTERALAGIADELTAAGHAVEVAEAEVERRDQALRLAEAERHSWTARADALALALDEARERAGAERLADVDGVLGTLLELVEIDEGWEAAFEAALGDAMASVVVRDVEAARQALATLRDGDMAGAVLALGVTRSVLEPHQRGGIRPHVRSSVPAVESLLDALVGAAVVVQDWHEAVETVLGHPGALVVTRAGDRFGASGWRVGVARTGATGAALEEALRRTEAAVQAVETVTAELAAARHDREAAASAQRDLRARREQLRSQREAQTRALADSESRIRTGGTEREAVEERLEQIAGRLRRDMSRRAELEDVLPGLEAREAAWRERSRELGERRELLASEAARVGTLRTDLEVRLAELRQRRDLLRRRLDEIDDRLALHARERAEAEQRRIELASRAELAEALRGQVADRLSWIEDHLGALRSERAAQSAQTQAAAAELDAVRRERAERERELAELRERANRAELDEAEVTMRLEAAIEALRRNHDCEPGRAVAAECPELAPGVEAAARVRELERELRVMGPVNPLALQEYEALKERHDFLQAQLDDVRSTRRELFSVIRSIDAEIVSVFAAAFADVAANFEQLFGVLFPGGTGKLMLTNPDDLLCTGVEVEAKPSGKNVRKLSLLSGGERSLTALAFLFAVFRSRPSPFYVMDEVEAALDDVNLHRFLELVDDFRNDAQLLIVSHQKRTMEAADCLYGVSMQPGGSSKVVSERAREVLAARK